MLIGTSLHISWKELACKDEGKTPYPSQFVCDGRLIELIVVFERIRQHFGSKSITINSAYRTVQYNKKVGGSPKSQHLLGRALDLQPPGNMPVRGFYNELQDNAAWLGIKGLGRYKTFVHIDIRKSDKLITWNKS